MCAALLDLLDLLVLLHLLDLLHLLHLLHLLVLPPRIQRSIGGLERTYRERLYALGMNAETLSVRAQGRSYRVLSTPLSYSHKQALREGVTRP